MSSKLFLTLLSYLLLTSHAAVSASLYPLAAGNLWTYRVSSSYPSCPGGTRNARVLGQKTVAGRAAYEVSGPCNVGPAYVSPAGDAVDVLYNGGWWRMLGAPVADGLEWTEFRAKAVWKRVGTLTVPAGTFTDCWRKIRRVSYTDWSELCSGVGLVRSTIVDMGGGYLHTELQSYALH